MIPRSLPLTFADAFPHGCFGLDVTPVLDFDASTKETKVQARDKDTGMLLWAVNVLDGDPEAPAAQKTLKVKVLAPVQPVLPEPIAGTPLRQIEFEGLTVTPWIEDKGRPRIAYSLKATGVSAPKSFRSKHEG
jgi:hypothetical protein